MGGAVQSGSGRAVMRWFDASQRGLALGVRQTAVPVGGLIAAVVLPALPGPREGFLFLAAIVLLGAVAGARRSPSGPRARARRGRHRVDGARPAALARLRGERALSHPPGRDDGLPRPLPARRARLLRRHRGRGVRGRTGAGGGAADRDRALVGRLGRHASARCASSAARSRRRSHSWQWSQPATTGSSSRRSCWRRACRWAGTGSPSRSPPRSAAAAAAPRSASSRPRCPQSASLRRSSSRRRCRGRPGARPSRSPPLFPLAGIWVLRPLAGAVANARSG